MINLLCNVKLWSVQSRTNWDTLHMHAHIVIIMCNSLKILLFYESSQLIKVNIDSAKNSLMIVIDIMNIYALYILMITCSLIFHRVRQYSIT